MSIAWVFPGQGSQKVGMADQLLNMSGANARFSLASELLGRDLLAHYHFEMTRSRAFRLTMPA